VTIGFMRGWLGRQQLPSFCRAMFAELRAYRDEICRWNRGIEESGGRVVGIENYFSYRQ
jgi:hypothetical protein